ncbi:hypothetical protein E2P81_ATG06391 [Venturia nashicola]|uniref:Uncharacterized protein n=1 Tax=Venturia nashicola TaxID=86259 RepID=A0A4Z1P2Y8_9PEZI|nr:hypothetical protein E6O75_ATG06546 [Venturia nashicola]TLD28045.1 hypothetical protein E2P81_ATG06391 [Venturia nashicola]
MPKKHDSRGGHGLMDFRFGALSAGAILSIVAAGYKSAEFLVHAKKLTEVGHENALYGRIMERVRLDLAETDRLLKLPEVKHAMKNAPDKLGWIQRTITALKDALREMDKYVYRVASDKRRGKAISWVHRFRWVLDDSEKAAKCRGEVGICHEGLLEVLSLLSSYEDLKCSPEDDEKYEKEEEVLQYRDADDDLQRRYEEKARYILQQERDYQGRPQARSEERFVREPEDRYQKQGESRYEERPQRRSYDPHAGDRGGYVDREVRISQHQEYVPTRNSRDRVVYDREESPQRQGDHGQLRVHWSDN